MNTDFEELLRDRMDSFTASARVPAGLVGRVVRRHRRRRAVTRVCVVTAVAAVAAAAAVASIRHQGGPEGPPRVGPPAAETAALTFITRGGYIDVTVRDPLADPSLYQAEFKAHGLKNRLFLLPVSPSLVGTVVSVSTAGPGGDSIKTITAKGRCWTGGGGSQCPVGLKVPVGYRGQAALAFGRAARPGERYEEYAPVDAPGEAMHGLGFRDKTVAAVLAMLRQRHVTAVFQDFRTARMLSRGEISGTWYVYDAIPWAPQRVLLRVGMSRTDPLSGIGGG